MGYESSGSSNREMKCRNHGGTKRVVSAEALVVEVQFEKCTATRGAPNVGVPNVLVASEMSGFVLSVETALHKKS